jgi:hypothetical protein
MTGISLNISDLTHIICHLTNELELMEKATLQRQLQVGGFSIDAILLSLSVISQATLKCHWTGEAVSLLGNPMNLKSLVCYFISVEG